VVFFCNHVCQANYHPIHKKECVNAGQLFRYWGFLLNNDQQKRPKLNPEERIQIIRNHQASRRRRALKLAAAAAMAERARQARMAANNGKGKGKQHEKEETCVICQLEFTLSSETGSLACPGSHFMCGQCTGVYVKSVLSDLETSFPPRCYMCRAEFAMEHFERQLTTKEQLMIHTHRARLALKPGEKLINCTECDYFEVVQGNPVVWWCTVCEYGTCFVYNDTLPRGVQKYDLDRSPHAACKQLRHAKAQVEAAIEEGSKMKCPACGLAGRKDDACTHMLCVSHTSCSV
jgi:hypothetical protein